MFSNGCMPFLCFHCMNCWITVYDEISLALWVRPLLCLFLAKKLDAADLPFALGVHFGLTIASKALNKPKTCNKNIGLNVYSHQPNIPGMLGSSVRHFVHSGSGTSRNEKDSRVAQILQIWTLHIRPQSTNFRGSACVKSLLFNFGYTGYSILSIIAPPKQNTITVYL